MRISEVQRIKAYVIHVLLSLVGLTDPRRKISFQDRAKEAAWGRLDNQPKDLSSKKRIKVALGPNENPNNGITMIVEGSGKVSIVGEDGQGQLSFCLPDEAPSDPSTLSTTSRCFSSEYQAFSELDLAS